MVFHSCNLSCLGGRMQEDCEMEASLRNRGTEQVPDQPKNSGVLVTEQNNRLE
jgi:hypothetical protein